MFGYNFAHLLSASLGVAIILYPASVLFRYAIIGNRGKKSQFLWIILLTVAVIVGLNAFDGGIRALNEHSPFSPQRYKLITGLMAGAVVFLVVLILPYKSNPTKPVNSRSLGRILASVLVFFLALAGLWNLAGGTYSAIVHGPQPGSGWDISKAQMRDIMLNGQLADFWHEVDKIAPNDMDALIDRLYARKSEFGSREQTRKILWEEAVNFRLSLAAYGHAMTDGQRKELLKANIDVLRKFEDQPDLCIQVASNGGKSLTEEDLNIVISEYSQQLVSVVRNLLLARNAFENGVQTPNPPSELDYMILVFGLSQAGMADDLLQALLKGDTTHKDYCSGIIAFMQEVHSMPGESGESIRFEMVQAMIAAVQ